jgi:hypothetical protein
MMHSIAMPSTSPAFTIEAIYKTGRWKPNEAMYGKDISPTLPGKFATQQESTNG